MVRSRTLIVAAVCALVSLISPFAWSRAAIDDVPEIVVSRQLLESQRLSVGDVVSLRALCAHKIAGTSETRTKETDRISIGFVLYLASYWRVQIVLS